MRKQFFVKVFGLSAAILSAGLAQAGNLTIGAEYDGWSASNSAIPLNGNEFMVPFSTHIKLDDTFGIFGQTDFMVANYNGTPDGSTAESYNPSANLSDSVIGTDIHFNNFGAPAMLNLSLNLPTGDQNWEENQVIANIPTEFIDSRYRGRGFGFNGMYGLSIPSGGNDQFGVAVGYLFSGSYNTLEIPDLDLGDSIFVGVNRVEAFSNNKSSAIRLSTLFFLPTSESGSNIIEEGPNVNASYSFTDPAGFSYEIGAQFFTPASRALSAGNPLTPEAHDSLGQRFYAAPSLAFGNFTVAGLVKYVLPNDYSQGDALYDGGGLMLGLTPSLTAPLNGVSDLKFTAGYDYVVAHNFAASHTADMYFNFWQVGTNYEIKL